MQTPLRQVNGPRHNRFLATLPEADWARWCALLEPAELCGGQILYDSFRMPTHAYFPITATVSMVNQSQDGASVEIAVVGNDGLVGISPFTGNRAKSIQAVVQSPGYSYRMCARAVKQELNSTGPLVNLLLRHLNAILGRVAQTALCNRFHSIEQQVCRRLLLGLDYSASNELAMTQQEVANLLGVRREGVTAAAQKLQQDGVIQYRRGSITVLDRRRLEQRTCECYEVTRRETEQLFSVAPGPGRNTSPAFSSPQPARQGGAFL